MVKTNTQLLEVLDSQREDTAVAIDKKKKKKNNSGISKQTINIIRTTQRNNIDLTAIADNKANVLLSLNAIIVAALIPIVIANVDIVFDKLLIIPLALLAVTSFITMYMSAQVLKPSNFDKMRSTEELNSKSSPFHFGNFYQMEVEEYFNFIEGSLNSTKDLKSHIAQDLFYIGKRLGEKMAFVRRAYNIFLMGILITLLATAVVLM
ncbi:MAG: Pycsar system effector family protein [Bacteroidota bacterium]